MAVVNGGSYHEFYQLSDGTPVGKLGAMHYILDENGEKLVDEGFHEVHASGDGYRAKTGAAEYRIKKSGEDYAVRRVGSSSNRDMSTVNSSLDPEKETSLSGHLENERERVEGLDREVLQQTTVGFPGMKARRVIESYQNDQGEEIHEYRTELVVLGKPFQVERGTVNYSNSVAGEELQKGLT